MQATKFIWQQGKLIPWQDATTHVLAHGLHYGSAVFEGIRFYKTKDDTAIFKLTEHVDRFFYSTKQLAMPMPYSKKQIFDAIVETVAANEVESGYIRPLAFYGYGWMKLVPDANTPVEIIIACWPWGKYIAQDAIDMATSSYIRIHPKSTVANAKISGHYVNSILAGLAIKNTPYHEALLLDAEGYVAEASSSNIFIVKNGALITPAVGTILEGVTRATVIEIAKHYGIALTETKFIRDEIYTADEAFLTGTAVEILPIKSLDDRIIGTGKVGPITKKINTIFQAIVHGEDPAFKQTLTHIPPKGANR